VIILAAVVSAAGRGRCAAPAAVVGVDDPGIPVDLVLSSKMRAMRAYRRQERNSGMM